MPKSSTRIAIEAIAVVALSIVAWQSFQHRGNDPAPVPHTAPLQDRETHVMTALQQRRAAEMASRKNNAKNPEQAFRVEATGPAVMPGAVKQEGTVSGELLDEQGQRLNLSALILSEEAGFTFTAVNGRFKGSAAPGHWRAFVQYRDGVQIRRAGPFSIDIVEGRETPLSISLPVGISTPAGPGFTWGHRGDFLEVESVLAGTAAADAGLAPGDGITEIGGRAVTGLDAAAIEAMLAGEEGSSFQIKEVAHTGDRFTTTVVDLTRTSRP